MDMYSAHLDRPLLPVSKIPRVLSALLNFLAAGVPKSGGGGQAHERDPQGLELVEQENQMAQVATKPVQAPDRVASDAAVSGRLPV